MSHCRELLIVLPEYPYDPFVAVLMPSGTGEVHCEHSLGNCLGLIRQGWDAWETKGDWDDPGNAWIPHPSFEAAVRWLVEHRVSAGSLSLTRVELGVLR